MTNYIKYNVDMVLCIDATGSMSPIIDMVKSQALKLHEDLMADLAEKDKHIDMLRVKIIAYRDYYCDGNRAMIESKFYKLPTEKAEFSTFVNSLDADGGGDEPENGLEALALAIKSDWVSEGDKKRHLVVVWTDASSHQLERSGKPESYPKNMPKDLNELTDLWCNGQIIGQRARRLLLFGPSMYPWSDITDSWDNVIHFPSKAGEGLRDMDYQEILNTISQSI
jgi:hypothetical protein